jgi:hypothetical protein
MQQLVASSIRRAPFERRDDPADLGNDARAEGPVVSSSMAIALSYS